MRGHIPAPVPIGRPAPNTEVLILDEHLQFVPPGARGQLFIGGPGVALGYVANPELTQLKFIAHPWRSETGARLYATGDFGRTLPSGDIEFLGRSDEQIKVRGFRIETGEIETALRACPSVADAVVVVRDDPNGGRKLVAYLATGSAHAIDVQAVAAALRRRLPAHCIPDAFVPLAALPLSTGGKLDRRALPAPAPERAAPNAVAPANELQEQLVRLWERFLAVRPIGIRDDFFAVGGHSLLAVRMIGELEREFAIRLPLAVLFNSPTIEGLALALCSDQSSFNRAALVTLNPAGTAPPLFFLHGSLNGGGFYAVGLARELGADRPLHLLRPHGTDGGEIATIEAMAADYLDLVIATQPHGPYLLGGFCSGGFVALEIARRLRLRNECVSNVILIETGHPGRSLTTLATAVDRGAAVLRLAAQRGAATLELLRRGTGYLSRLGVRSSRLELGRGLLKRIGSLFKRRRRSTPEQFPTLEQRWRIASERFIPRRYDGRLTILTTIGMPQSDVKHWSTVSSQAEILAVPGDHFSCITEHVATTASIISAALDGSPASLKRITVSGSVLD